MDHYLWNEREGLYYDYDTDKKQHRIYDSVTTLWPLWSGACSAQQAQRIVCVRTFLAFFVSLPTRIDVASSFARAQTSGDGSVRGQGGTGLGHRGFARPHQNGRRAPAVGLPVGMGPAPDHGLGWPRAIRLPRGRPARGLSLALGHDHPLHPARRPRCRKGSPHFSFTSRTTRSMVHPLCEQIDVTNPSKNVEAEVYFVLLSSSSFRVVG